MYILKYTLDIFCILHYVFCILYSVFCIRYSVFCILHSVFCLLFSVSVFCTVCCEFYVIFRDHPILFPSRTQLAFPLPCFDPGWTGGWSGLTFPCLQHRESKIDRDIWVSSTICLKGGPQNCRMRPAAARVVWFGSASFLYPWRLPPVTAAACGVKGVDRSLMLGSYKVRGL